MDSSKWPIGPDALFSSHHTQHGLSRRAFLGGAAATAAGASLGTGLLWPAAGSAASLSHRGQLPKPTTAIQTVNGINFHVSSFGPKADPSSITEGSSFVEDLDADSLALIELVEALEEELGERTVGFRIDDEDLEDLRTVRDAVDYVYAKLEAG